MSFAAGSLVRARNREWVVLPDSSEDFLLLRPLGGANDEVSGILTALENVEPATFTLPNPARAGDHRAARLLRDAARIGFRSSAGPFRSFGAIAVEPRPYQLVPLLMALRLDPVRLLIADDVGIGKTIEAGLIAKELLVSGDAKRMAVLCPPHLAEQWQRELAAKFHIDTELVLASTAGRLERSLGPGESIFEAYPYTVVSTDFIKAEKRRSEFLRSAPDLVIVDEAHTCAADAGGRSTKHQRYELLRGLSSNSERQLLLVTATPHSGNEGAFRSLVGLLDQQFSRLPEDDRIDDATRAKLARYFVQRRRADIRSYLDADTPFPDRLDLPEAQGSYHLSPEYREFVQDILAWAREAVSDESGGKHRQRVRWWSVLALLRSLASSPAAAAATLRNRAAPAQTTTVEEADEAGRRSVLDQDDADDVGRPDATPGADPDDPDARGDRAQRRRLGQLALQAEALSGEQDVKLVHATRLIKSLLKEGYQPIVFCRFIPTADYVAEHLRKVLGKGTAVEAVTGLLPPAERESRVLALGERPRRVLVATDCLSEGINLQDHFDAVVHYDLPWNPTRLEQREGRVDRYGQPSPTVKVATVFGVDNVIDEIVLEVLLRKHKKIRSELGVSIPVPGSNDEFIETIFERLFSRQNVQIGLFSERVLDVQQELFEQWDRAAEKEKVSRTRYAQHAIKTEAVAAELAAAREAIGSTQDLERFVRTAVESLGGTVTGDDSSLGRPPLRLSLGELPRAVRDLIATDAETIYARFQLPVRAGEVYLSRTHPLVEGLAAYLFDTALDAITDSAAARCGAIRTTAVNSTTTMVLVRNRFDIVIGRQAEPESQLLAEGLDLVAFRGSPSDPSWLADTEAQALLTASPSANVGPDERERFVRHVLERFDSIRPALEERASLRAKELGDTHLRVRQQAGLGGRVSVTAHHPADILGLYLYLPA